MSAQTSDAAASDSNLNGAQPTLAVYEGPQPVRVMIGSQEVNEGPHKQRIQPVICSKTAPVIALSTGIVVMERNHVSLPHRHRGEIVIYVVDGFAATLWGPEMEPMLHGPESQVWMPPGCPHAALSLSGRVVAIEARTDPSFVDDVDVLPELAEVAQSRVDEARAEFDKLLARNPRMRMYV